MRNFLKGIQGNAINALLCAAGRNMRRILRKLWLFLRPLGVTLRQFLHATIAHLPANTPSIA